MPSILVWLRLTVLAVGLNERRRSQMDVTCGVWPKPIDTGCFVDDGL